MRILEWDNEFRYSSFGWGYVSKKDKYIFGLCVNFDKDWLLVNNGMGFMLLIFNKWLVCFCERVSIILRVLNYFDVWIFNSSRS